MKRKILTTLRIFTPVLLVISAAALGIEIFARDFGNPAAITAWGIVALTALGANAALAIHRLFVSGGTRERQIAVLLFMLTLGFYAGALARMIFS